MKGCCWIVTIVRLEIETGSQSQSGRAFAVLGPAKEFSVDSLGVERKQ